MRLIWGLSLLLTGCPEPAPAIPRVDVVDAICAEWKTSQGRENLQVWRCASETEVCFTATFPKHGPSGTGLSCFPREAP